MQNPAKAGANSNKADWFASENSHQIIKYLCIKK
jgi:hypothetical protein